MNDEIRAMLRHMQEGRFGEAILEFSRLTRVNGFAVLDRMQRAAMNQDRMWRMNAISAEERGHLDYFERHYQEMFHGYHAYAEKIRLGKLNEQQARVYFEDVRRLGSFWRSEEQYIYDILNDVEEYVAGQNEVMNEQANNLMDVDEDVRNKATMNISAAV